MHDWNENGKIDAADHFISYELANSKNRSSNRLNTSSNKRKTAGSKVAEAIVWFLVIMGALKFIQILGMLFE